MLPPRRHRGLQVLGVVVISAHLGFEPLQHRERLAFGMQELAEAAVMDLIGANRHLLRHLGDGRQRQHLPAPLLHQVAGKVVDVQALHDEHDGSGVLIVEAAEQGVADPLLEVEPPRVGLRVGGLQRVIDDNDVAAPAGERASGRCGEPEPAPRRHELGFSRLGRIESSGGEGGLIPGRHHHRPAIARVLGGKVGRIADADDPGMSDRCPEARRATPPTRRSI